MRLIASRRLLSATYSTGRHQTVRRVRPFRVLFFTSSLLGLSFLAYAAWDSEIRIPPQSKYFSKYITQLYRALHSPDAFEIAIAEAIEALLHFLRSNDGIETIYDDVDPNGIPWALHLTTMLLRLVHWLEDGSAYEEGIDKNGLEGALSVQEDKGKSGRHRVSKAPSLREAQLLWCLGTILNHALDASPTSDEIKTEMPQMHPRIAPVSSLFESFSPDIWEALGSMSHFLEKTGSQKNENGEKEAASPVDRPSASSPSTSSPSAYLHFTLRTIEHALFRTETALHQQFRANESAAEVVPTIPGTADSWGLRMHPQPVHLPPPAVVHRLWIGRHRLEHALGSIRNELRTAVFRLHPFLRDWIPSSPPPPPPSSPSRWEERLVCLHPMYQSSSTRYEAWIRTLVALIGSAERNDGTGLEPSHAFHTLDTMLRYISLASLPKHGTPNTTTPSIPGPEQQLRCVQSDALQTYTRQRLDPERSAQTCANPTLPLFAGYWLRLLDRWLPGEPTSSRGAAISPKEPKEASIEEEETKSDSSVAFASTFLGLAVLTHYLNLPDFGMTGQFRRALGAYFSSSPPVAPLLNTATSTSTLDALLPILNLLLLNPPALASTCATSPSAVSPSTLSTQPKATLSKGSFYRSLLTGTPATLTIPQVDATSSASHIEEAVYATPFLNKLLTAFTTWMTSTSHMSSFSSSSSSSSSSTTPVTTPATTHVATPLFTTPLRIPSPGTPSSTPLAPPVPPGASVPSAEMLGLYLLAEGATLTTPVAARGTVRSTIPDTAEGRSLSGWLRRTRTLVGDTLQWMTKHQRQSQGIENEADASKESSYPEYFSLSRLPTRALLQSLYQNPESSLQDLVDSNAASPSTPQHTPDTPASEAVGDTADVQGASDTSANLGSIGTTTTTSTPTTSGRWYHPSSWKSVLPGSALPKTMKKQQRIVQSVPSEVLERTYPVFLTSPSFLNATLPPVSTAPIGKASKGVRAVSKTASSTNGNGEVLTPVLPTLFDIALTLTTLPPTLKFTVTSQEKHAASASMSAGEPKSNGAANDPAVAQIELPSQYLTNQDGGNEGAPSTTSTLTPVSPHVQGLQSTAVQLASALLRNAQKNLSHTSNDSFVTHSASTSNTLIPSPSYSLPLRMSEQWLWTSLYSIATHPEMQYQVCASKTDSAFDTSTYVHTVPRPVELPLMVTRELLRTLKRRTTPHPISFAPSFSVEAPPDPETKPGKGGFRDDTNLILHQLPYIPDALFSPSNASSNAASASGEHNTDKTHAASDLEFFRDPTTSSAATQYSTALLSLLIPLDDATLSQAPYPLPGKLLSSMPKKHASWIEHWVQQVSAGATSPVGGSPGGEANPNSATTVIEDTTFTSASTSTSNFDLVSWLTTPQTNPVPGATCAFPPLRCHVGYTPCLPVGPSAMVTTTTNGTTAATPLVSEGDVQPLERHQAQQQYEEYAPPPPLLYTPCNAISALKAMRYLTGSPWGVLVSGVVHSPPRACSPSANDPLAPANNDGSSTSVHVPYNTLLTWYLHGMGVQHALQALLESSSQALEKVLTYREVQMPPVNDEDILYGEYDSKQDPTTVPTSNSDSSIEHIVSTGVYDHPSHIAPFALERSRKYRDLLSMQRQSWLTIASMCYAPLQDPPTLALSSNPIVQQDSSTSTASSASASPTPHASEAYVPLRVFYPPILPSPSRNSATASKVSHRPAGAPPGMLLSPAWYLNQYLHSVRLINGDDGGILCRDSDTSPSMIRRMPITDTKLRMALDKARFNTAIEENLPRLLASSRSDSDSPLSKSSPLRSFQLPAIQLGDMCSLVYDSSLPTGYGTRGLDVVIFHGLEGASLKTWRTETDPLLEFAVVPSQHADGVVVTGVDGDNQADNASIHQPMETASTATTSRTASPQMKRYPPYILQPYGRKMFWPGVWGIDSLEHSMYKYFPHSSISALHAGTSDACTTSTSSAAPGRMRLFVVTYEAQFLQKTAKRPTLSLPPIAYALHRELIAAGIGQSAYSSTTNTEVSSSPPSIAPLPRSILWTGHSMGGILVQWLLLLPFVNHTNTAPATPATGDANVDTANAPLPSPTHFFAVPEHCTPLRQSTGGAVFYATPHTGSPLSQWGAIPLSVSKTVSKSVTGVLQTVWRSMASGLDLGKKTTGGGSGHAGDQGGALEEDQVEGEGLGPEEWEEIAAPPLDPTLSPTESHTMPAPSLPSTSIATSPPAASTSAFTPAISTALLETLELPPLPVQLPVVTRHILEQLWTGGYSESRLRAFQNLVDTWQWPVLSLGEGKGTPFPAAIGLVTAVGKALDTVPERWKWEVAKAAQAPGEAVLVAKAGVQALASMAAEQLTSGQSYGSEEEYPLNPDANADRDASATDSNSHTSRVPLLKGSAKLPHPTATLLPLPISSLLWKHVTQSIPFISSSTLSTSSVSSATTQSTSTSLLPVEVPGTDLGSILIVPSSSADSGCGDFVPIPGADHVSICKPMDPADARCSLFTDFADAVIALQAWKEKQNKEKEEEDK